MKVVIKGPCHIQYCGFCNKSLRVTSQRDPYCPRCDITLSDRKAEAIMLCAMCEYPLRIATVANEPVSFCTKCNTYSMPQTEIREEICPRCRSCHEPGHCIPNRRKDN